MSLRTVQRIESGDTEPRGDTLTRIANTLEITLDEIVDWTKKEDKGFVSLLHLSALSFLFFPLFGTTLPMALWVLKRDKIMGVDDVGKKIINFQITWSICLFSSYAIMFFAAFLKILHLSAPSIKGYFVLFAWIGLMYLYNIIAIIGNLIKSGKGKKIRYKPAIGFLGQ